MLARQACRQHAVIGNDMRVEMTKNALNLCDFSNNSSNCSGPRWLILLAWGMQTPCGRATQGNGTQCRRAGWLAC